MKSLNFKGATLKIGGTQQEYNTLHAIPMPTGEVHIIFELTEEELAEITRTRKLVYTQLTFGMPFQPMRLDTKWPGSEPPEILPDTNKDPKLN